jgi:hypothetical protein
VEKLAEAKPNMQGKKAARVRVYINGAANACSLLLLRHGTPAL